MAAELMKPVLQKEKNTVLLEWAERIIQQRQYETLQTLEPRALELQEPGIAPEDVTCLFQVTELVFRREEGSLSRFTTVLNALHAAGASCLMLLECRDGKSELYLGAVNKQHCDNIFYMNTIRDILRTSVEGNLPGTQMKEVVSKRDVAQKLNQCLDNGFDSQCVTAVSCVAGDSKDRGRAADGIESLLEAAGGQNFTLMVLADPVSRDQMRVIRKGYQDLSTQLSANSEMSVSIQTGKSTTLSENYSETMTKTMGQSISLTQSHTSGTGWSRGSNRSEQENGSAMKLKRGMTALASVGFGQNALFAMNLLSGMFVNPAQNSINEAQSGNESDTTGKQTGQNESIATGTNVGTGRADATNEGVTVQTTARDRHTKELLDRVEWYLDWLNHCENFGMFNCCAYVLSSNAGTNLMVASQYQAIMQEHGEMSQPVTLNTWTLENGAERVKQNLMRMQHPVLQCDDLSEGLTPAMLMSSRELSRQMALPQRSVVGVSVMEYAAFGREVVRKTPLKTGRVMRVGAISHMGKTNVRQPVILDVQSMAAHTFVAGTNGSGKSNTVFRILEELMDASIPFMVIEPAKGEYKNVFGREPNVRVYGTNSTKTALLRLNPFWFNEDVNILEHIDKLIDVFNASWPMYAAMPAILKAAIENAYRSCGWHLKKNTCRGGRRIFPTVQDVLVALNGKMESTAFSEEVKGNYVGALSTRLESLGNGIYGEIFGGRNLTDQELFDSNVIIDLSRVGAAETKSMIMGMLVIRLQEYRMQTEAMNLPLKHITVLEEAHHLLRRTSTAQSEDGSNMLGKSVEMISNAIAEMRSYGEGFIIVDQSPGLMDMSVMRNTNTKMILRLPEAGDRDMVGNTMGLTAEQIYELSRLKTGVCAIYQKDWLEAVLCQVDRAKHEEVLYRHKPEDDDDSRRQILSDLLSGRADAGTEQLILECGISGRQKRELLRELSSPKPNRKRRRELADELAGLELELPDALDAESVELWYRQLQGDWELLESWGEALLPELIQIRIERLAAQDRQWETVMRGLPGALAEHNQQLLQSRGRAFARICPLHGKPDGLNADMKKTLEQDCRILEDSGALDGKLAQLLHTSLDTGSCRKPGELSPYTDLVWELLGGQETWDRLFPLFRPNAPEQWDQEARRTLRMYVRTDLKTETALLSLYLQRKGANPSIRSGYSSWYAQALRLQNVDA